MGSRQEEMSTLSLSDRPMSYGKMGTCRAKTADQGARESMSNWQKCYCLTYGRFRWWLVGWTCESSASKFIQSIYHQSSSIGSQNGLDLRISLAIINAGNSLKVPQATGKRKLVEILPRSWLTTQLEAADNQANQANHYGRTGQGKQT